VLLAVVKVFDVSVAVRVQAPFWAIWSALKVATPALAVAVVVPPRVHEDVIPTVSVRSLFATVLSVPSIVTLKRARFVLIVAVVGGSVVNTT
jgi:hypothetical protein